LVRLHYSANTNAILTSYWMTKHLYYWTWDATNQSSVLDDHRSSISETIHPFIKAGILFTETDAMWATQNISLIWVTS